MLHSYRLAIVLLALAVTGALAFAAAASQAAIPPPMAAKATVPTASDAAAPSSSGGGDASQAGEKIGAIVRSWGTALLLSVAGLLGLIALGRRSVGEGITLLVIVVIVGGFIYAPEQVKGFIQSIWQPIAGG